MLTEPELRAVFPGDDTTWENLKAQALPKVRRFLSGCCGEDQQQEDDLDEIVEDVPVTASKRKRHPNTSNASRKTRRFADLS
jgi:hypothetical protein